LPSNGGSIEIIDGNQNMFPKNISSSNGREYVFRGTNPAILPVIDVLSQATFTDHFLVCGTTVLLLENLLIHHTWNTSSVMYSFNGFIFAESPSNITMNTLTFTTVNTLLLTRSCILYSSSDNYFEIKNCTFHDISLMKCSLIYDYWRAHVNVLNTTFKNIVSL
jgi:hypothetical protein